MINWKYRKKDITSLDNPIIPKNAIGFIYRVEFSNGFVYIGKKNLFSKRKRVFGKKEAALITDKRLKKYEYVTKESDWISYIGSSELLKVLPASVTVTSRQILHFASTSIQLTYLETKELFVNKVLESDKFYNANILGKFFRKDVKGKE